MELAVLQALGVALGLGLLVGLQREWADKGVAGIRTFPLIALLGVLSSLLAQRFGGWVLAGSFIALAAMMIVGHLIESRHDDMKSGVTSEMAALVIFAVGAILAVGEMATGLAVGGIVAVLLHWKRPLHDFAQRIGEGDFREIMRLVLIALVILPGLPDRTFGPYHVLNPFKIWLMVVLIVGISLGAYVIYKLVGARAGTILAAVLGGLISSTATTFSQARQTRDQQGSANGASVVIMVASAIVFARVIFLIAVVAPDVLATVAPPLLLMGAYMALWCTILFFSVRRQMPEAPAHTPRSNLKAAIVLALLYAVILLAVAAARQHFGNQGIYVVAVLSGLTDMDAITLSSAQLINDGVLAPAVAWRAVLMAAMANLVFKGLAVAVLGDARLRRNIILLFGLSFAGGVALLIAWP